jgi:hypothetical protein
VSHGPSVSAFGRRVNAPQARHGRLRATLHLFRCSAQVFVQRIAKSRAHRHAKDID